MSPRLVLRWLLRETRGWGGRLVFFIACLAVGVAAVVAVASLSAGVRQAVRAQARELLAADLVVRGRRPAPEEVRTLLAAEPGLELADVKEMASMAAAPAAPGQRGPSLLVQLKAVGDPYPFHGGPTLEPDRPIAELLDERKALVAPELLRRLGLEVGDELLLGGERFEIAGRVLDETDRAFSGFALGPRVFVSLEGLARTPLEGFGSRVTHRVLVRVPGEDERLAALAERLRTLIADSPFHEVETWREGSPALQEGLRNAERFLGLVALLSLLVGGLGVARTVQAWLATRLREVAVLKCLGLRPREVVALHLAQVALLALAGSLVGALLGVGVAAAAPPLLASLLPVDEFAVVQPLAILEGLGLGVGVALLFAIAPLAEVWRLPPARVLRSDAEPPPPSLGARSLSLFVLLGGLTALATVQSGDWLLGLGFTGGVAVAALALAGAARLVVRGVAALPRRGLPFTLRHGLAALARPAAGTTAALVALGLGILAVLGMAVVETQLREQLASSLPEDAPSVFFVDVQPDQWPLLQEALAEAQAREVDSVPMLMARLAAVDGRPVEELADEVEDEERRWVFTREQRLTWAAELPEANEVVAGAFHGDEARPNEISVERDFAADLGAGLGSVLSVDVQGVPMDFVVTSLREVDWGSFRINFFFVAEPGLLEAAPHSRLAAARVDGEALQGLQDRLAVEAPNVTVVRIRDLLERVRGILGAIGLGVRLLGTFTVLAGLAILAGVVSAGAARRGREVALLKTLGATRAQVAAALIAEQALVGLVAGTIGALGGALLAGFVLTRGMELEFRLPVATVLAAIAVSVVLAATAGVLASLGALRRRPIEVLRSA